MLGNEILIIRNGNLHRIVMRIATAVKHLRKYEHSIGEFQVCFTRRNGDRATWSGADFLAHFNLPEHTGK